MIVIQKKGCDGSDNRENPWCYEKSNSDRLRGFYQGKFVCYNVEEGDCYDQHITINSLYKELREETACNTSWSVLKVSSKCYYCDAADGTIKVQEKFFSTDVSQLFL